MSEPTKFWEGAGKAPSPATNYMKAHSMDLHDGHHLFANAIPDLPDTPEIRLMTAVFNQALKDIYRNVHARSGELRTIFWRAELWFDNPDREHLYSFFRICDHLGLDAEDFRRRLRLWIAKQRKEGHASVSAPAPAAGFELDAAGDAA